MDDLQEWIGRSETRHDIISGDQVARFAATLDRDDPVPGTGAAVPPLSHWLLFLPNDRQSDLGPDGHRKRGDGLMPPIHHLPRRMWAGSRIIFGEPLRAGMLVERRSTIASIREKQGAAGPLVFVTVRHEIAEPGGLVLVTDEHDIVYRGLAASAKVKEAERASPGVWHRSLVPDTVLLFRYSALTFNGHRIHYDRDYTVNEEGYPGLIVHGPLTATLLLDLLRRQMPDATVKTYEFRAVSPLFDGRQMHLYGDPPDAEGVVKLRAADDQGRLAMRVAARIDT